MTGHAGERRQSTERRDPLWRESWRADPIGADIADRHYNRQSIGSKQFVPPGRCVVLLSTDNRCLWVTSWPFAEYVKHAWPGAWMNSTFRRDYEEDEVRLADASEQIREAVAVTRWRWPEVPDLGMVTFIDPKKVRGIKVRGQVTHGYSYMKAGFKYVGLTKGGLMAFQMVPADMPEPTAPDGVLVAS